MKALLAAGLCLALLSLPALAQGKKSQEATAPAETAEAPPCEAVPSAGEAVVCRCEAGPATGSVWGSGPYTADSDICTAARHRGVIGEGGGTLHLTGLPGAESYQGSAANGVQSNSWGAYGQSFDVAATGGAEMAAADYSDAPVCEAVPVDGASLVCRCAEGPTTGSVWGSGPYTADSDICTAARHRGVIGEGGGALELVGLGGAESYEGSAANGVQSNSWGAYGQSFDVRAPRPVAAMAAPADAPPCDAAPADGALLCACPADAPRGSVWGSGPYTADSDICTAARHAGVIGAEGGTLRVEARPGQDGYDGSEANGVRTQRWGAYGQSFAVLAAGSAEATGPAPCDVLPSGADALECTCTAEIAGAVWGAGPYTSDSNICSAARHAGAVGAEGVVKVLRVQGLASYAGTSAHGETTQAWDGYDSSIVFDRN